MHLRGYKVTLDKEKQAKLVPKEPKDNINNSNQNSPSTPEPNKDGDTDITKEFKNLNLELKQLNLTVFSKFLNVRTTTCFLVDLTHQ